MWIFAALLFLSPTTDKVSADFRGDSAPSASAVKTELARTYLRENSGPELKMTANPATETDVARSGPLGTLFGDAEKNFVFAGKEIYRLIRNPGRTGREYYLEETGTLPVQEGPVLFRHYFHEDRNGQKIWFLVLCYEKGYCQVTVSGSEGKNRFALQIDTGTIPADLNFFLEEEELLLLIVKDPCVLYRWTGTYFDQQDALETTGARSAAVFRRNGNTVIVVAQNLPDRKVRSKVFARKKRRTELIQLLPTSGALKAQYFSLKKGTDLLDFVFVLNEKRSSSVYWWNGKELSLWKSVEEIFGRNAVYVDHLFSETFLFLSNESRAQVYRLTEMDFRLLRVFTFDRPILSLFLRKEEGPSPTLIVLTGSDSDPFLNLLFISIQLDYFPLPENQKRGRDPILECLAGLSEKLKFEGKKRSKNERLEAALSGKNGTVRAKKVSMKKTLLEECEARFVRANPSDENSEAAATRLEKDLSAIRNEFRFSTGFDPKNRTRRLRGEVGIRRLKAVRISVEAFGGDRFLDGKYLSLYRDEKLGKTKGKKVSADNLKTEAKDLIVKNKSMQPVSGIQTLTSIKSKNLRFTEGGKINGIFFSEIATFPDLEKPIKGKKRFPRFQVQNLSVETVDEVSSEKWAGKILPILKKNDPEKPLDFSGLTVKNLRVATLDGYPWDDFLKSIHLPRENGPFSGNLSCPERIRIRNLNSRKLNGISAGDFFTKSERQEVSCSLKIKSAKTKKLKSDTINGSGESSLKDLLENYNFVSEPLDPRSSGKGTADKFFGVLEISRAIFKNPVNVSGTTIDLKTLQNRFWMKNADQTVRTGIDFAKNLIVADTLKEVKKIGGNQLDSLLFLDGAKQTKSELIFEDVSASRFSSAEEVLLKNLVFEQRKALSKRKKFTGSTAVKKLRAEIVGETKAASISIPTFPDDVKLSELTVYGGAAIENGTDADSVDGLSLDEELGKILSVKDSTFLNRASYDSLIVKRLEAERFNDMKASPSLRKPEQRKTPIDLTVEGNLFIGGIKVEKINGLFFDGYLNRVVSKKETPERVKGRKTFRRKTKIIGDVKGAVDGFDANHFESEAFSKTKFQNVTGFYRIQDVKANALIAELIDGIKTERLLFQDDPLARSVNSDLVFNRVAVASNLRSESFMNRCDLNKILSRNLEDVKKLSTLDAKEDFSWENSEERTGDLSRIFSNAVKACGNETVSGPVVFGDLVSIEYLDTKRHLNEFDLGFVLKNALYRSLHQQELSREVAFKGTLSAKNVVVFGNSLVDHIDDLEILNFDYGIVKKNAPVKIRGGKEFRNAFAAQYFDAGYLNRAKTDKIIFYDNQKSNDSRLLPSTVFDSLKISVELEVEKVDEVDLKDLFSRRWTVKTKRQALGGNVLFKGKTISIGSANVSEINGIRIAEVIAADGESRKTVFGMVKFDHDISFKGKVTLSDLDGHDPAKAKSETLSSSEKVALPGNIMFAEEVRIEEFCEVNGNVNGDSGGQENVDFFADEEQRQLETAKLILDEGKTVSNPEIFMHLEETSTFDLNLTRVYGSDAVDYGDSIEASFRGWRRGLCGLPEKCLCPAQTTLAFSAGKTFSINETSNFARVFKYFDRDSLISVTVTTTTVSYDRECRQSDEKRDNEETVVSWREISSNTERRTRIENGFLNDVKFFRLGDSVYIVTALAFDPSENGRTKFRTVVYELMISAGNLTVIDEISSEDSKVVEVFWTPIGVVLVEGAEIGSIGIYRFIEAENKFRLLRSVQTHGVSAIKSMKYKKESFIFVVQKQSWPLLILKYDPDDDNYHVKQKRDTAETDLRSDFLSVSIISISEPGNDKGDMFVGVVLSDDRFGLFKYKHIEGFVETSMQEQENVKILQPFQMDSEKYLIGASAYRPSKIYRFVKQG